MELHTSMPGTVTKVDVAKKTVDVKPDLKRKYINETDPVDLPVIPCVPLGFLQTQLAIISVPVKVGDTVTLHFSERSIDKWKSTDGPISPDDPRKHALSDAIAVPGAYRPGKGIAMDANDILIKVGSGEFRVIPDGKFKLTNGTDEVIDLIVQLLAEVSDHLNEHGTLETINTIFGAVQPNNFAKYVAIKILVDAIKTKMEGLKG